MSDEANDAQYKRVIVIEGVKVEVDLRTAKQVNTFRVGDRVKLLEKNYGSSWSTHPGIIVAIDAFRNLPTIVIAYVKDVFSNDGKMYFANLNAASKDLEICPMAEDDIMPNRETATKYFDYAIKKQELELEQVRMRKEYFLRQYGTAFGVGAEEIAQATAVTDETGEAF